MNRSQYPTELTTSRCKVIVTQRESIQIFKPHTLKAQWPSVISPLIRASTFFPALQSFPMQQLRKQSYLVLPGNRNSLASKINNWGGTKRQWFRHSFQIHCDLPCGFAARLGRNRKPQQAAFFKSLANNVSGDWDIPKLAGLLSTAFGLALLYIHTQLPPAPPALLPRSNFQKKTRSWLPPRLPRSNYFSVGRPLAYRRTHFFAKADYFFITTDPFLSNRPRLHEQT
jgi:hypothetical protein